MASFFLGLFGACARFNYFCRLDFGNNRYTGYRLFDHINNDGFDGGSA